MTQNKLLKYEVVLSMSFNIKLLNIHFIDIISGKSFIWFHYILIKYFLNSQGQIGFIFCENQAWAISRVNLKDLFRNASRKSVKLVTSVKVVTSVSGHSRSLYSDPISFISGHTNKDIFGYYIIDYCPGFQRKGVHIENL